MARWQELGELGLTGAWHVLVPLTSLRALLHLGNAEAALQAAVSPPPQTLCLAHLGRVAEVEALLEQLVLARPDFGTEQDETRTWSDVVLLEAAVLVQHQEAARRLHQRLRDSQLLTTGMYYPTCIGRHLGAAAALLGQPAQARSHYEAALAGAQRLRFRPEVALVRLGLADLLRDGNVREHPEALAHLDLAIPELDAMQMQPALARALRLRDRLSAPVTRATHGRPPAAAPAYPDGLSEREVAVLRLLAAGKSNQDIAAGLVISPHTVIRHVSNIFAKTGVANRVEAATYAHRHGLVQ